ncbi:ketopantoate reductase family protein [Leifsonia sp. NPDC058194]|uniref:ketopantoate reductase family protein n=1 Tax=Leifsonia sp. NPDC058194 TaxID=3346374 RepID=UPI0036DC8001
MFGRGVIATIYGQALQAAGHDVEYFVRPGRVVEYGSEVRMDVLDARRAPLGRRVQQTAPTRLRDDLDPSDAYDLVVLSVGHHRLVDAAAFLAPRLGDATLLVFGNVWEEPLSAIAPIPAEQVVFGFPQGGGGFTDDGVLHGALLRPVIVGTAGSAPSPRELAVQGAFRSAGFSIREEKDMRGWLLLHFAADAGMHAQGRVHGGLAAMIGDRTAFRDALLTAQELLPVVEARGVDLRRHRRATLPFRRPGPVAAVMAWTTAHIPIANESLAMHTDPDAAEPRAVLRDAIDAARRLGVQVPRLKGAAGAQPAEGA